MRLIRPPFWLADQWLQSTSNASHSGPFCQLFFLFHQFSFVSFSTGETNTSHRPELFISGKDFNEMRFSLPWVPCFIPAVTSSVHFWFTSHTSVSINRTRWKAKKKTLIIRWMANKEGHFTDALPLLRLYKPPFLHIWRNYINFNYFHRNIQRNIKIVSTAWLSGNRKKNSRICSLHSSHAKWHLAAILTTRKYAYNQNQKNL